jgi:hypothetical protein
MPGWCGVERDLDLHRHRGGVVGRAGRGPVASPPSADQHCRETHPAGGGASSASPVSGWRLDQFLLWRRRSTGPAAGTGPAASPADLRSGTGVRSGTAETAGAGATCGTGVACSGSAEAAGGEATCGTGVACSGPTTGFGSSVTETPSTGAIQAGKAEAEAETEANGVRASSRPGTVSGCGSCGAAHARTSRSGPDADSSSASSL